MKKTYSHAIGWAVVSKKQTKSIWHNEPDAGSTFSCEENVAAIHGEENESQCN